MGSASKAKFVAQLDRDWASARDFISDSPAASVMRLTDLLCADDPDGLIAWMKEDERIADVVQRLALLSLHEATRRLFDDRAGGELG